MIDSTEWVLKAILSRLPDSEREALEKHLSEERIAKLSQMPSLANLELDTTEPPLIDRVHWSWLLPFLKTVPAKEQKLYLSALPYSFQENLIRELGVRMSAKETLTPVAKEYLLKLLIEDLTGSPNRLLPVYFLPSSPLTPLLHLHKADAIRLVDFLSLYDLAAELRQIVETKILKKIYSFLSEEEKRFLKKEASRLKEAQSPIRLGLEKWDGNEKSFRHLLHKRGLARLSAALIGQHPDFIWYVCHQFDIGRGNALQKFLEAEKEAGEKASEPFVKQIEDVLREIAE